MIDPQSQDPAAGGIARSLLLEGIQQAYWVGQSATLDLSIPASYYVEAEIPDTLADGLSPALDRLIQRHEMLRAVVTSSGAQRVLDRVQPFRIDVVDLRGTGEAARMARRDGVREAMNATDFPPDRWPQFDIRGTRDETGLRLHLRFALWMMDGWSFHLFLRELLALASDPSAELPPIEMSFVDYVDACQRARGGPDWRAAWDYWKPRLSGLPGPPSLPLTQRISADERPSFRHLSRVLSAERWKRIVETCTTCRITPSLLACAVYAEVLSRYAGSSHFSITVLYSGRFQHLPEAENAVGNFGTTILLEADASGDRPFIERVRGLQRQFWRDAERVAVSGLDVTRALQRRAGGGPGVGVPVTFTAVTVPAGQPLAGKARVSLDHSVARLNVPQVHLDHQLHFGVDGSAIFNWDYVEQLFPSGFVEEMSAAHLELFKDLANDAESWSQNDPCRRARPVPEPAAIPAAMPERLETAFERNAAKLADRTAVIAADRTLTYAQLRARAVALSGRLRAANVEPGQRVAVSMNKGWEQVVAVLGILYAGGAYVPVDPDLPAERRALLFEASGARIVLTQAAHEASLEWPRGLERISVDLLGEAVAEIPWTGAGTPHDLAYVIFTSGSTGMPKGVMIDHCGAWSTIVDLNRRFGLDRDDKVLALSSLSFDLSVYDIFGTLAAGGTIVVPDAARAKEASHWRELAQRHGVTVWNSVPALMQLAVEGTSGPVMPSLRLVMLSGDWIPLNLPGVVRPAAPGAAIWSLGGATEASIWSVLYPIGDIDPEWRSIPYGHAMDNQSIHVLDSGLRVCPAWVPGDLYIGGVGVALGYLGDDAKTAASFIRHPETGERLYRTGDMGRYLADGEIEFLGRKDFQVKIQGFRVECAEVEAALLRLPGIGGAVVAAAIDSAGTRHLVGYVVAEPSGTPIDFAGIKTRLGAILPAYMVPTGFVELPELPLSDNGKVVRSALPAPDFGKGDALPRRRTPPRDALEEAVAGLWLHVLGSGDIGRDDNFFALGGSSFAGMRLMARLEERFARRVSFATLVANPTVAGIADVLRREEGDDAAGVLVGLREGDGRPPLFCIHPIGGNVMCYGPFTRALAAGRAIHGIRAPGLFGQDEAPLASISDMAARYVSEIRAAHPQGPYHLAGWSLGGMVVQEMARLLVEDGEAVGLAAMIDSEFPGARTSRRRNEAGDRFRRFSHDLSAIANLPTMEAANAEAAPLEGRIASLAERMEVGGVPLGVDDLRAIYSVFEAGSIALDTHRPQRFEGRLFLFEACRREGAGHDVEEWSTVARALEVVTLDADHYSIMHAPTIDEIARRIDREMANAEAPGPDRSRLRRSPADMSARAAHGTGQAG